jgi:two-component system, chemotaxis family, protein-glutamate methylesterase/glutaminase
MASTNTRLNGALRGVVAVGASAGGVEALTHLAAGLPNDLPYAILIALHLPPSGPSVLARILDRNGPLPAEAATDGAELTPGRIYVAVPDRHLLVSDHRVVVSEGMTENGHRPAINALFRSAALSYGPNAIGILLSGVLDDGELGLAAIRSRDGTTVVQHPDDALYPSMPINALQAGVVDHQVTAINVGALLAKLADREIRQQDMEPDESMEIENRIAMGRRFSTPFDAEALGPHSGYTCPDCSGSLMSVRDNNYRCHVGHAWTADALLTARDDEIENALWVALRSLREKATLSRRLASHVGPGILHRRYSDLADEADRAVTVLGRRLSEATSSAGERGDG